MEMLSNVLGVVLRRISSVYGISEGELLSEMEILQGKRMKKKVEKEMLKEEKKERKKEERCKFMIPFCPQHICRERCMGLAWNGGLLTQCGRRKGEGKEYCNICNNDGESHYKKWGTVEQRLKALKDKKQGLYGYKTPKGNLNPLPYRNFIKSNISDEEIKEELSKFGYTNIPEEHFTRPPIIPERKERAKRQSKKEMIVEQINIPPININPINNPNSDSESESYEPEPIVVLAKKTRGKKLPPSESSEMMMNSPPFELPPKNPRAKKLPPPPEQSEMMMNSPPFESPPKKTRGKKVSPPPPESSEMMMNSPPFESPPKKTRGKKVSPPPPVEAPVPLPLVVPEEPMKAQRGKKKELEQVTIDGVDLFKVPDEPDLLFKKVYNKKTKKHELESAAQLNENGEWELFTDDE